MLKLTFRTVLSKLSLPLWLAILLSATVPVFAAQQHRANLEPAAIGPTQTDAAINVTGTPLTVSEPSTSDTFTISLNTDPAPDSVTIPLSTSNGQCNVSPTSVVLDTSNYLGETVTVTPVNDAIDDGPQTCNVQIGPSTSSNGAFAGLTHPDIVVTIGDDDEAGVQVTPTSGLSVVEGGATDTFAVSLTSEPEANVSISLSTGAQCTASPTPLNFTSLNWDQAKTVTVSAVDDDIVDDTQSCTVTGSASAPGDGNYHNTSMPSVSVSVQDNDSATVRFASPTDSVNETAGTIDLAIQLSKESTSDVSVLYTTADGTATAGQDYTAETSSVLITAGNTTGTISIPILNDSLYEGNETFTVSLTGSSGASVAAPDSVTVTILPDGDPQPEVRFSQTSYTVSEGTLQAEIAVTLNTASGSNVEVTAATTSGGTATAGSDYTATTTPFTFLPGETSKTFNVPITNDSLYEANESVQLELSGVSGAALGTPSTATLTITDNDSMPSVSFDRDSYSVGEGNSTRQVIVELSAASGLTVTVDYTTSDNSAVAGSDYTATSGTLTFAPNDTVKTFNVPIIDDDMDEPLESLNLTLTAPNNAQPGSTMSATIFITDNDPTPMVRFFGAPYSVPEGGGSATITVVLSNPAKFPVSVDYATANDSATAPADYTARDSTLVFSSGVITRTFTVPINDDLVEEGAETLGLTLSDPQGATLGTPSNSVLTIIDNEGPTEIHFASTTYSVTESVVTATIGVVRSGLSILGASVNYATSPGSATAGVDYMDTSGTLNFGPNETSKSFSVTVLADQIANEPDETVNLALSNPSGATLGTPSTAVLTIQDTNATPAVQFSQDTYTVDESMLTADITVTLNIATAQPVTVFYGLQAGTATQGDDYGGTGGNFTIPAGQQVGTFTVPLLPDQLDEPDETVIMNLTGAQGAALGARTSASLIIVDNDPTPTLSFSLSSLIVGETDGTADLPVRLSAASGRTVTVNYATVDGSATAGSDYIATQGTLTFAPGETSKTINVPLLEGLGGEPNETFEVWLSTPTNATLSTPDTVTVTIVDGELVLFSRFFPITVSGYAIDEPNNGCSQAYEIFPFRTYHFLPNDKIDYYRFELEEAGNLIVEVTNFVPIEGQAALWKGDSCDGEFEKLPNNGTDGTDKTIDAGFQEPGGYILIITNDGEFNTSEPYRVYVRIE